MLYTTYYAESNSITEERYIEMKKTLQIKDLKKDYQQFHLRKLEFLGSSMKDAVPNYFLCMKNRDTNEIFLEKKYVQNGLHHKKCVKISLEECNEILEGRLEWMKGSRKELLADFYRQATLNNLFPGRITDYQREMYRYRKGEYVTFTTSIERGVGHCRNLLEEPQVKISCLDEDKVLLVYKKAATIPRVVSNMLQGQESQNEDYAFIF